MELLTISIQNVYSCYAALNGIIELSGVCRVELIQDCELHGFGRVTEHTHSGCGAI